MLVRTQNPCWLGRGPWKGPQDETIEQYQSSRWDFSPTKTSGFLGTKRGRWVKARLRMCNKMQSIWDYMRTYVYMCLEVCTHVVLVVCESVYAFKFLYPLCACVCVSVCVCACVHAPVGLLIFTEGARINSSSDWESACSMSSYAHLGSFCLRSVWSSLSTEGGFCSPFSWS